MTQEKMTPELFASNIEAGKYSSAGSARKGLAKAHLSAHAKVQLNTAIDTWFGNSQAAVHKTKVSSTTKKDGTPKGKPGRKPGQKMTTVGQVHPSEFMTADHHSESASMLATTGTHTDVDVTQIAAGLNSVSAALAALKHAHELNPNFQAGIGAELSGRTLTHLLEKLHNAYGLGAKVSEADSAEVVQAATEEPTNILRTEDTDIQDPLASANKILGQLRNSANMGSH